MSTKNTEVTCHICTQNLDGKVQVYWDGKVYCEQCNWREGVRLAKLETNKK